MKSFLDPSPGDSDSVGLRRTCGFAFNSCPGDAIREFREALLKAL